MGVLTLASLLMTWAQRLKRVFDKAPLGDIDIETCSECGGDVRIIASIEDPVVIQKILTHLDDYAATKQLAFYQSAEPLQESGYFLKHRDLLVQMRA
jgi:hypothetical protein